MPRPSGPVLLVVATGAVGACAAPAADTPDPTKIGNVPEAVAELAAPRQDLSTARLRPDDNCYWYMHAGPVETTIVPLRTESGNAICAAPAA